MSEGRLSFSENAILRAFGERVRELRTERGWSQEQLMDRAQLDRSYVSQVENGQRNPSLLVIAKIASALNVEPADLLVPRGGR
ncbi:helix-turn-helix transcriptional regulator [Nocardioides sp. CER19]|uniref:helix-turn-helix domain-containing protein n=1 Tax=Nocardioides sp. CER19 TaxID=3038538 RepID=UPI002449C1C8|nr:helix-turn-helix transcriptional regulator [Nocardioides sp. CER19]MDH2415810.1 helix-turn-helix transcriptional regulator [Nocardioides sp. CER19]